MWDIIPIIIQQLKSKSPDAINTLKILNAAQLGTIGIQ